MVTFNINLNSISFSAPSDWNKEKNAKAISNRIEDLNPDVFSLQEIPDEEFCQRFSDKYQYSPLVASHSGFSSTFVKHQYEFIEQIVRTPFSGHKITYQDQIIILLGGHLLPFEGNYPLRFENLQKIISDMEEDEKLIIFGDMNMRENETRSVTEQLSLQDAFITIGEPSNQRFTWDSSINIFRKDAYTFIARFDRIFYRNLRLVDFQIVFNQPILFSTNHFLSDHFGLFAKFRLLN
jgi:endonuclease/exonuclease/phosphatase family metal-dependent hydrolase